MNGENAADGGKKYVFIFSQVHLDFRIAEFKSICSLFNIKFDQSSLSTERHVIVIQLDSEQHAQQILSRSMLVHSVVELLSYGANHEELYADIESKKAYLQKFNTATQSFAIRIRSVGRKRDSKYYTSIIDKIGSVLPIKDAPVNLSNPHNVFTVIEEFSHESSEFNLRAVYFGKLVGYGQSKLKSTYNLSNRCYIGNTTMDPELSFIQANLSKADSDGLILDPFCGTGGLLLAAAHFGSYVFGTEINYQIARACGKSSRMGTKFLGPDESVAGNFLQYGLNDRFISLVIADASRHNLWHISHAGIFNAIVTDPPYGVREKGSKVGNKQRRAHWTLPGSKHIKHFPEKARYKISSVFLDLLDLAATLLVVNGRVSFWFPVFDNEYSEDVLPKHGALRLVANCKQPLAGKYSRRLLVYEKTSNPKDGEKAYFENDCYKEVTFRERVFLKNV